MECTVGALYCWPCTSCSGIDNAVDVVLYSGIETIVARIDPSMTVVWLTHAKGPSVSSHATIG